MSNDENLRQHEQLINAHADAKRARDLYAELYDFAPVGYLLLDADGAIHECNLAASAIIGRERHRMLRIPIRTLLQPDQKKLFGDFLQHVRDDPATVQMVEVRIKTTPQRTVRLVSRVAPTGRRSRRFFTTMTDVTAELQLDNDRREALEREQARSSELAREVSEHAEAEARVKGLLRRLVTVQEQERRRLSRDLHDQLGQQLTALRLTLSMLGQVARGPEARTQLDIADAIAERLDRDVDHLAWELRPAALDELGLVAALDAFVKQWSSYHRIDAEFRSSIGESRFATDIENHLYRIVQEALNNVVKHAGATGVQVAFERSRGLRLTVHDNGHGFDPSASRGKSGMGLLGMRERVALIGGRIEIESSRRHGTTISVFLSNPAGGSLSNDKPR